MASFRDRFYTRRTGNLITSPTTIVLAGAASALVVASGAPLVLAPVAAVAAGAARVLAGMEPADRPLSIDARSLSAPWRGAVEDAQQARARFRSISPPDAAGAEQRFGRVGEQIDEVVARTFALGQQGERLARARSLIDTERLTAERSIPNLPAEAADALDAQVASAGRLDAAIANTVNELLVVNARLDELVARTAELSVDRDVASLAPIEDDLVSMLDELEAARQAARELD